MTNPDILWRSTTDVGDAVVSIEGSRVAVVGSFDNGLTDPVEDVAGTADIDCGEMPDVPVVTTTLPPDYEAHGSVTIEGETLGFTYDPDAGGRCGAPGNDGRIINNAYLVDDPSRNVVFAYGLPEATPDGKPHLQLIIYGSDGQQLWYSAVGFVAGSDTGSVDTLEQEGSNVTATGTLLRSGSSPEEFSEFSLQATCDQ